MDNIGPICRVHILGKYRVGHSTGGVGHSKNLVDIQNPPKRGSDLIIFKSAAVHQHSGACGIKDGTIIGCIVAEVAVNEANCRQAGLNATAIATAILKKEEAQV